MPVKSTILPTDPSKIMPKAIKPFVISIKMPPKKRRMLLQLAPCQIVAWYDLLFSQWVQIKDYTIEDDVISAELQPEILDYAGYDGQIAIRDIPCDKATPANASASCQPVYRYVFIPQTSTIDLSNWGVFLTFPPGMNCSLLYSCTCTSHKTNSKILTVYLTIFEQGVF
jgi:hypothetical protein